jgi:hypothetical protein
MKKRSHSSLMWGAVLVFVAVLVAIAVEPGLRAQDCKSAESLAAMSRTQAEGCFSWDFD